ncbi:Imm10 family immunity protein [Luteimicrobium subarcticum]|uniref:Imm10 family immunity protein n=1 Tax=Luteimicrobium subarcticum TaxID=620910 RepID=UPI000C23885F
MIKVGFIRSEDLNCEALVLLDVESGDTIEIQRSIVEDDAQAVSLGQDTYAIVRDASAVHYGGLAQFEVQRNVLVLDLEPGAASVLELPDRVELVVDDAGISIIEQHLPRLLARE